MTWFGKKDSDNRQQGIIVALEGLSADIVSAQLQRLEQELLTAGFSVRRLEFPSSSAETNIAGLIDTPNLLKTQQSLGIVAALDRARVFDRVLSEAGAQNEVVLLTGSVLNTAAWLATQIFEAGERVALYRWLDELEHIVFAQRRMSLVVLLDCLPEHIDMQETFVVPVGWGSRSVPEIAELRSSYVEAAKLYPNTKIVHCHREGLLKPDLDIQNEIWNLVRRIALKSNVPPRI